MQKICERCGQLKNMMSWEKKCYKCMKEEALEKIQQNIKDAEPDEEVDTWSDDYVICPYCGYAMETNVNYEDLSEIYEEGDHDVECPECEKCFRLTTSVSYSWETEKIKEG